MLKASGLYTYEQYILGQKCGNSKKKNNPPATREKRRLSPTNI
jgi:CRISPR/Cas system-associated protein Cas7 (RAMP superfamily)